MTERSGVAQPSAATHATSAHEAALSCYTSALLAYLAEEDPSAPDRVARSTRLAVQPSPTSVPLVFRHHAAGLDRLPDGTALRPAGAEPLAEALAGLAEEVHTYGRALFAADAARLPWAPPGQEPAPHFLVATARGNGRWYLHDHFTGLFPNGQEQLSFSGWVTDASMAALFTTDDHYSPVQRRRTAEVFGRTLAAPPKGTRHWFTRVRADTSSRVPDEGTWCTDPEHIAGHLLEHLRTAGTNPGEPTLLEDLWAASRHHQYKYRRALDAPGRSRPQEHDEALRQALTRWSGLPRTLRFAINSARRGRPRDSLLETAVHDLARAEDLARSVLLQEDKEHPWPATEPSMTASSERQPPIRTVRHS
ncbi:hypothetical protein ABZ154_31230 [Streptomyces sp. NPDC006261]|uniref:hypothetical protein n=1 Tax=Streptomyces sp. NPDC006261 TaxID=3156739 RepID=UPI0033A4E3F0